MAEVIGIAAGAAQLYVSATEAIKLAMELRDELANGPQRIRDHVKGLESTISVLRFIENDPDAPNTNICCFVHAVKERVERLLVRLQNNRQSLSSGSFTRVIGALKTVKSAGKLDDEFAALDREKANLHLYISVRSDSVLQKLVTVTSISSTSRDGMGATADKGSSDPNKDFVGTFVPRPDDDQVDESNALVPYQPQAVTTLKSASQRKNSDHTQNRNETPESHTDQPSNTSRPRSQRRSRHKKHSSRTNRHRDHNSDSDSSSDQSTRDGHNISTHDNYGNDAFKRAGDDITSDTPDFRPKSHKIRSEDTFGDGATTHYGNLYEVNTKSGSKTEKKKKRGLFGLPS